MSPSKASAPGLGGMQAIALAKSEIFDPSTSIGSKGVRAGYPPYPTVI